MVIVSVAEVVSVNMVSRLIAALSAIEIRLVDNLDGRIKSVDP